MSSFKVLARIIFSFFICVSNIFLLSIFIPLSLLASFISNFFKRNDGIVLGVTEIASNLHSIQKSLDDACYSTHSVVISNKYSQKHQFGRLNSKSTRRYLSFESKSAIIKAFKILSINWHLAFIFIKFLLLYRTWFFVWSRTFLPANIDLIILKIARKKIIMMHCGDDVRYRPLQRQIDQSFGLNSWSNAREDVYEFFRKFCFVRLSEIFSDFIISHRDQATLQQIPYLRFRFPMPEIVRAPHKSSHVVRIVHAPSCRKIKGTDIVLGAMCDLKDTFDNIEFILLEAVPNNVVIEELSRSDILIDQPGSWAGRLSIEGCAAKCVVIGGNKPNYIGLFDSPILQFPDSQKELVNLVSELLKNPDYLASKKEDCYHFWQRNYSPQSYQEFFTRLMSGDLICDANSFFLPIGRQRDLLLKASCSVFISLILRFFYWPTNHDGL